MSIKMKHYLVLKNKHLQHAPYPGYYYYDPTYLHIRGVFESHEALVDLIARSRSLNTINLRDTSIRDPTHLIEGITRSRTVTHLNVAGCSSAEAFIRALPRMQSLRSLACRNSPSLSLAIRQHGFINNLDVRNLDVGSLNGIDLVSLKCHNVRGVAKLLRSNNRVKHLFFSWFANDEPMDVMRAIPESLDSISFSSVRFSPNQCLACIPTIRARRSFLQLEMSVVKNEGPIWDRFVSAIVNNPIIDPIIRHNGIPNRQLRQQNAQRRTCIANEISMWVLINRQKRLVCKDVDVIICSYIATASNPKSFESLLKRQKVRP